MSKALLYGAVAVGGLLLVRSMRKAPTPTMYTGVNTPYAQGGIAQPTVSQFSNISNFVGGIGNALGGLGDAISGFWAGSKTPSVVAGDPTPPITYYQGKIFNY